MPTLFRSILKCGKPILTQNSEPLIKGVYEMLEHIKTNPMGDRIIEARKHKKSTVTAEYEVFEYGKKVIKHWNEYERFKHLDCQVVTWGIDLKKGSRRKKSDELVEDSDLTQYVYYDIDSYENCTIDEVLAFIATLPVVAGAWKSLSGVGGGFLVKFSGLTKQNFTHNFNYYKNKIEEMFKDKYCRHNSDGHEKSSFVIDSLSDFTRINVISYDPSVFINQNCYTVYAMEVPEKKKNSVNIKKSDAKTPFSVQERHIDFIFNKAVSDPSAYNAIEHRLTYKFFATFFELTNICGIELENALAFLDDNHSDKLTDKYKIEDATQFGEKIYDAYQSDFCSFLNSVYIPEGYELKNYNVTNNSHLIDIKTLLKKIFYDIKFYVNDTTSTKFALRFAEECKVRGIIYRYVSDHCTTYNFTKLQLDSIESVYGNPWKLFGAEFTPSEDILKKKLEEYLEGAKKIENAGNIASISDIILTLLPKEEIDGQAEHQLFYSISMLGLSEGVELPVLCNFLDKNVKSEDALRQIKVYAADIYSKFSFRFGIGRKKIFNDTSPNIVFTKIIPTGKFLSDVGFSLPSERSIIWGDTSIGKTHYLVNKKTTKMVILVPTTNILESIKIKHPEMSVYYGQVKSNVSANKVVSTYSSFPALYATMQKEKVDMSKYILCVDESHNFSLSTQDFRSPELNFLIKKFDAFKNVLMFTGTNIHNCHPVFESFKIFRFRKENPEVKNLIPVFYKSRIKSIAENCDPSGLNVILLQSKNYASKLGDYIKYFTDNGYSADEIWTVNSDEKSTVPYKHLIKHEHIPKNIKILITTSLLIEGSNIKNTNCRSMHFATFVSPHLMEQFANRFRKKVPGKIYTYFPLQNLGAKTVGNFNIKEVTSEELRDAKEYMSNLYRRHSEKLSFLEKSVDKSFIAIHANHKFLMEQEGKVEVDHLSINSFAVKMEESHSLIDHEYMMGILKQYNWEMHPPKVHRKDLSKQVKSELKVDRMERKGVLEKKIRGIFDRLAAMTFLQLTEHFERIKSNPDPSKDEAWEISVVKKILTINQFMELDDAKNIILAWIDSGFSENNFYEMQRKINLHYTLCNFDHSIFANPSHPFSRTMLEYYDHVKHNFKDKVFTDKMLVKAFKHIRSKYEKTGDKLQKKDYDINEIKNIFSHYIALKDAIAEDNTLGVQFAGLNHLNDMKAEFTSVKKYIASLFDKGLEITKDQLFTFFTETRKHLPTLGNKAAMKKFDRDDAFLLMKLYCDLDKQGKTYKVVDKSGLKMLNGVKWRVEQSEFSCTPVSAQQTEHHQQK